MSGEEFSLREWNKRHSKQKNLNFLLIIYNQIEEKLNIHKLTLFSSSVLWQRSSEHARVKPNKMYLARAMQDV